MLRKLQLLVLLLLVFIGNCFSQYSRVGYKNEEYVRFKASKTYFVKTGDEECDKQLEDAMKSIWKITPCSMITPGEFENMLYDKSVSFVVLSNIGLILINGGKRHITDYSRDDAVAYALINFGFDEYYRTDCAWRLKNMLQSMLNAINIVQENKIKDHKAYDNVYIPKHDNVYIALNEIYNLNAPKIKNRTLLISEPSLGKDFNKTNITTNYPYKVEICPRSKIKKAIEDKSTDYYYLQLADNTFTFWFVVDPANGEIEYANYGNQGTFKISHYEAITVKEIKEMVEFIDKK